MNDVDGYLNEVCWAMGGALSEQQAVRDELRAHIRDEARELELAGALPADAIARALRDLGDPAQLGRSLRSSRGTTPLRRPLVQPEGALILERRVIRHMPPPSILFALAALALAATLAAAVFVWP